MGRRLMQCIFTCALMACILYLGIYYLGTVSAEKNYESIRDLKNEVTLTPTPTATNTPSPTMTPTATPSMSPTPTLSPTPTPLVILGQYEKLYEKNNDFAGWIHINIDGAKKDIDYPVMHIPGDTEDFYYLWRNFDKEGGATQAQAGPGNAGSIFIDGRNELFPERSANVMIYGHNMKAGTMFAQLHNYKTKDFYENHKYIQFDTLYTEDTYEIVAVFKSLVEHAPADYFRFYLYTDFKNEATFNYYFENIKRMQLYDTGITPEYGDEFITLITCAQQWEKAEYDRLAVIARKIKKAENEE